MTVEHDNVRVGIVLEVDDSPVTLYIWAHLVAATMVDNLQDHGIVASLVRIDIDGSLTPRSPSSAAEEWVHSAAGPCADSSAANTKSRTTSSKSSTRAPIRGRHRGWAATFHARAGSSEPSWRGNH